jgi:hypothetical protein
VEANQDHAQRLQSALAQLDRAHGDIELREQDSFWKDLKANDAQDRIDEAKQAIRQEMNRASL